MVEIFHAQNDLSAKTAGAKPRNHEGPHIAEVKRACRAWRKAAYIRFIQNFFHSATKLASLSGEPSKAADVASFISEVSRSAEM